MEPKYFLVDLRDDIDKFIESVDWDFPVGPENYFKLIEVKAELGRASKRVDQILRKVIDDDELRGV